MPVYLKHAQFKVIRKRKNGGSLATASWVVAPVAWAWKETPWVIRKWQTSWTSGEMASFDKAKLKKTETQENTLPIKETIEQEKRSEIY